MVHFRRSDLLGITANNAVLELDVTGVPTVLIAVNAHERGPAAGAKRLDHRPVRRIEPAIAIGHKKLRCQTVKSVANRATRPDQHWPVNDVLDLDAEPAPVADK